MVPCSFKLLHDVVGEGILFSVNALGSFIVLFLLGRVLFRERLFFAEHPSLLLPIAPLLIIPFFLVATALVALMLILVGIPFADF
jgi:hypothetical protein